MSGLYGLDLPLPFMHRAASAGAGERWLLVLMHGIGSNEADLFGLAPHVPPRFHVLSLRAPNMLAPRAFAWFEIGMSARGRVINEAQEAASRELVARTVAQAAQKLGVPPSRVVLGGFSQGGIMSLSLLLTQPRLAQAAMVMHGRLLEQVVPLIASAEELQGRQLWVSHGRQDQMIPLANAQAVRERVGGLPVALQYHEYPGGHEITSAELRDAAQWLGTLTPSPKG